MPTSPFEEQRPSEAVETQHTNAPDIPLQPSESKPEPQFAAADNAYPNFHVTYWMFYPYSQVSSTQIRSSFNAFCCVCTSTNPIQN